MMVWNGSYCKKSAALFKPFHLQKNKQCAREQNESQEMEFMALMHFLER